jgi:hypothetical protein
MRAQAHRLLLALPFLVGVAVLKGLTVEIDTFHASDARVYQLPTIMQLSERLDFSSYPSAQTPLFHLVMAGWGKLVGFELWKLRLLNVAISYAAVLALLQLLRRATPLGPRPVFALTLLFALSPYYLGASFTLLTDNLAILFALLALERLHRFSRDGELGTWALACLAIGAAALTRQSFLWLALLAGAVLLRRRPPLGRTALAAAVLGLALLPLAALVVEWGGLVPPGADPASCGLCTDRPGVGRDALTLRTVGFTFGVLGLYGVMLFGPSAWRRVRLLRLPLPRLAARLRGITAGVRRTSVAAAAAGVVLLLLSPLAFKPATPVRPGDAGYLWEVSTWFPTLLGSSLVFWGLVPTGLVVAALLVRRSGAGALPTLYWAAFLVAVLPVGLVYQKYFDPFALLALALFALPGDFRERWDYAGVGVLYVAFVAYALSFAG